MGASRVSYCYRLITGRLPFDILELHRQYGEVVRIAPNELVFANAQAWKDIMGHRGPGEPEMMKAPQMYNVIKDRVYPPPLVSRKDPGEPSVSLLGTSSAGYADQRLV